MSPNFRPHKHDPDYGGSRLNRYTRDYVVWYRIHAPRGRQCVTICVAHGTIHHHLNMQLARSALKVPPVWCPDCRALAVAETAGRIMP